MIESSPLMSTQWLAAHRADPRLRVVDIRSAVDGGGRAAFEQAHVPGAIHTDFERGFIKAEVIWWEDLVKLGSEAACRAAAKLAIEGKDYVVRDGDVIHFRFNV